MRKVSIEFVSDKQFYNVLMKYLREFYLTANFFNITGVSEQPFENVLEIPHWWWVSTGRKDNVLKDIYYNYYWDMYNN